MATQKQREAARQNIKKAQAARQAMSHREHARAQPEGRRRKKPGMGGGGDYFHVEDGRLVADTDEVRGCSQGSARSRGT